jgi:transcriptional regulator with XRE-family HTH domain
MAKTSVIDTSFGARLRRERERRQIALSSIATNTKISVGLFEGLERNDVSRWPSGIFRRAFIRAYAEAVGLDPNATTREFLELFPDPVEEPFGPSFPIAPPVDLTDASDLRLFLADEPTPVLKRLRFHGLRRVAAVVADLGAVGAIALGLVPTLDRVGVSLGISALGYYSASVLLLGRTPGLWLFTGGFTKRRDQRLSRWSSTIARLPRARLRWLHTRLNSH